MIGSIARRMPCPGRAPLRATPLCVSVGMPGYHQLPLTLVGVQWAGIVPIRALLTAACGQVVCEQVQFHGTHPSCALHGTARKPGAGLAGVCVCGMCVWVVVVVVVCVGGGPHWLRVWFLMF